MIMESHKLNAASSAKILLAVAALLGAFVLYQVAEFSLAIARAEVAVARATGPVSAEPNNVEAQLAQVKAMAEALKKKNLFVPPAPKENPIKAVLGILGNEALINNKWYKAGDSVGEAKILAVGPTKIRVSWNGQEKDFAPLGSEGGGSEGGPPSGRRGRPGPARNAAGGPGQPPPGGPQSMTAEEQAALRDRFRNASREERAKLQEEMRERLAAPRR